MRDSNLHKRERTSRSEGKPATARGLSRRSRRAVPPPASTTRGRPSTNYTPWLACLGLGLVVGFFARGPSERVVEVPVEVEKIVRVEVPVEKIIRVEAPATGSSRMLPMGETPRDQLTRVIAALLVLSYDLKPAAEALGRKTTHAYETAHGLLLTVMTKYVDRLLTEDEMKKAARDGGVLSRRLLGIK